MPGASMVARLFAPQFVILYLFAASATYVHFRGKMKLRLGRQLADHSTWLAPYNVLMYMFQAVPNKPVHAVSSFPELAPLRGTGSSVLRPVPKAPVAGRPAVVTGVR